eukprot:scaffold8043_cov77-Isochrysis_galbana.AAC.1
MAVCESQRSTVKQSCEAQGPAVKQSREVKKSCEAQLPAVKQSCVSVDGSTAPEPRSRVGPRQPAPPSPPAGGGQSVSLGECGALARASPLACGGRGGARCAAGPSAARERQPPKPI